MLGSKSFQLSLRNGGRTLVFGENEGTKFMGIGMELLRKN
jgi:hypothetical protein